MTTELNLQLVSRHPPISLQISLAGRIHDDRRQRRRRGIAVPAACVALGVEIVAQRLLVEARLRPAGLIGSAAQKRELSGVMTSSIRMMRPS